MKENLLLVEDDPDMRRTTRVLLERAGYRVREAGSAEEGLAKLQKDPPDLLISDINLPGISGTKMLEILRSEDKTTGIPVMLLTVLGKGADKVQGLKKGADDYVTKPFDPAEFIARVEALLRRAQRGAPTPDTVLGIDDLRVDLSRREVTVGKKAVVLQKKEFELLCLFLQRPGQLMSRDRLTQALWPDDVIVTENTLSAHIKNLRKKLGRAGDRLETLVGEGYRFNDTPGRPS